jgi:L-amino acid N-acyltransferase YncA
MAIEAVDDAGRIRGMVGYDYWTKNSCEAHMAADAPIAWRSLLGPAFQYPFEQIGIGILLAVIPAFNARSIRLAKHFGFREVHRIKDGWELGVDTILHELRREECRWLSANRKAA